MRLIADAYRAACMAELRALKPGNVHVHADGHRMRVADFVRSADVTAPIIARAGAPLGARVFDAVAATRAAVGQNTNLGILLLCAPIAMAAEAGAVTRGGVAHVLAQATQADADLIYRAIVLAAPGGLGEAPAHDVRAAPRVALRVAMATAARHDAIARAYRDDFADLFNVALPAFTAARRYLGDLHWAIVDLYLLWMARQPDSHVMRKQGARRAAALQHEAASARAHLRALHDRRAMTQALLAWDAALKREGINPGTSADLTVATTFAAFARSSLPGAVDNGSFPPAPPPGGSSGDPTHTTRSHTWREAGSEDMAVINKVLVGESLVGDGNEVAHIDLIMGPRGSAAESAFCNALVNNKDGFTSLLAVVAPNLQAKPNTVMFNKVTIKGAKQAVQMFGPAQYGVAKAVADSVAEGIIPAAEADDIFICVGVFIHWEAADDKKIQEYNYKATKESIARAVKGEPSAATVVAQRDTAKHPFGA